MHYEFKRLKGTGIKCDAVGCGFRIDVDINNLEDWRNKPCPVCGSNLLTDKDWDASVSLDKALNFWPIRFIEWLFKKFHMKERLYKIEMNGSGNMEFVEKKGVYK